MANQEATQAITFGSKAILPPYTPTQLFEIIAQLGLIESAKLGVFHQLAGYGSADAPQGPVKLGTYNVTYDPANALPTAPTAQGFGFYTLSYSAGSVPVLTGVVQNPLPEVAYEVWFEEVTTTGAVMRVTSNYGSSYPEKWDTPLPALDVQVTVYAQQ